MTPHHVRPDHHPLPTGSRTDGVGHVPFTPRPKPSTAPPGLWAPAPEVVTEKAVKVRKPSPTTASGRPSRAKPPHERKVKVATCGTDSGYKKHLRDKTPTCTPCREAHNVTVRAYDRNRVRKQYVRADCGTETGYSGHRTRKERICAPCREAHNVKQRERRAIRAEREAA
jgi:hypothetical protein